MWTLATHTPVLIISSLLILSTAAPSPFSETRQLDGPLSGARCEQPEIGRATAPGAQSTQPRCLSHLQVNSGTKRVPRVDDTALADVSHSASQTHRQTQHARASMLADGDEAHDEQTQMSGRGMVSLLGHVLGEVGSQDFNPFLEVVPGSPSHIWGHDMFPERRHAHPQDGDEGFNFFSAAPPYEWVILGIISVLLFAFDGCVIQRLPSTLRVHMATIVLWLTVAFLFNMWIWSRLGQQKALEWCAGYVLEWMLSMDNLFVFHLIFQTYQTPENQVHKAVFVGVIGAIGMRMAFFMVVSTLLHVFHWIRIPFGLLLIWSGVEAAKGGDDDVDVKDTALIRGLKWCLGSLLKEEYDESCQLFVWEDGRLRATLLFIVVACLEFSDIVFALDSVSAKVAQIPDQYIAFSSSVIAMFGYRAMFFVMQDLVEMFDLLQYGLCIILVFIGAELIFSQYIHLAASVVCILILSVFICCIAGSVAKSHMVDRSKEAASNES